MSRILLSFLGISRYEPVFYGDDTEPTPFFQEALARTHCAAWGAEDRMVILLTEEARKRNWEDKSNFDRGLFRRLTELSLPVKIETREIKEGRNEEEIWEIFNQVFSLFRGKEEVYYDVTHAYRSLPMIVISLLHYAKALKEIRVGGIFYGAFEARFLHEGKTIVPIFDLTSFSAIVEWSNAVNQFTQRGDSSLLSTLVEKEVRPILRRDAEDPVARTHSEMAKHLRNINDFFVVTAAPLIEEGRSFVYAQKSLAALRTVALSPLVPLIERLEEKVKPFKENSVFNGFHAVRWCLEHDLLQQGITLLQEITITYLLERCGKGAYRGDRKMRYTVSVILSEAGRAEKMTIKEDELDKDLREQLLSDRWWKPLVAPFNRLREYRNNINHAGYGQAGNISRERYRNALKKSLEEIEKVVFA